MKLKRLEIKGFKSFSDKTTLEFRGGVTSVVGPNGCGKSNVLEAIRWVMGEQRARILRGAKMGDVIFNGSENRKPVGMAEVRMILANDNHFAHPAFADYDEIMVTRRLFRDGESHYEINSVPCRLSDITDLFLDTGVGRASYSVVEQGRVEMVVASRPEDRRSLIEEAAGINRYKARKETALKKLEQTTRNLERIKDVVSEVKRQNASLKRQAAAAERYRSLQNTVRELDLALHSSRCQDARERYRAAKDELDRTSSALFEQQRQCASVEAGLEAHRLKALELDGALKDALQARHVTDLSLTSIRGGIQKDKDRLSNLTIRLDKIQDDKKELADKIRNSQTYQGEIIAKKSEIQSQLRKAEMVLEKALAEVGEARDRKNSQARLVETLKNDLFENLQQAAQKRNNREAQKKRAHELESNFQRIAADRGKVCDDLQEAQESNDRVAAALTKASQKHAELLKTKDERSAARKNSTEQIKTLRDDLTNCEKEFVATQARLGSLEEMQRDFATYDQSIQFLMKAHESARKEALLIPLTELMEVPPEYEKALIAALGDRMATVVVSSSTQGAQAAQQLKLSGQGRATFMPAKPIFQPEPSQSGRNGILKPLKDVITFREGFENLGEFLFANYLVAPGLDQALEVWSRNGFQANLVTLEGELLTRSGEITGGSWDHGQQEVFSKRREVAALRETLQSLQELIGERSEALHQEERRLEKLSAEVVEIQRLADDLHRRQASLKAEHIHIQARLASGEKSKELLVYETDRLAREKVELSQNIVNLDAQLAGLQTARENLQERMESAKITLQELDAMLVEKSDQNQETRVLAARLDEQYRSADREFQNTVANLNQMEERLAGLAEEHSRLEKEKDRIVRDLAEAHTREKELMVEHEAQEIRLQALNSESSSLAITIRAMEDERRGQGETLKKLQGTAHSLEMETVRLKQIVESIVEKTLDLYHVDPRTVPCPEFPPDPDEIAAMKDKLESMGEVNLAAIAESQQVNERLKFLQEQEQDLKKAVASLFETIDTINASTSDLFLKAFDRINEKFQEIFPFLFGGGEARLELTEEANPLETGVDIVARPPGKRRQNMSLLSGGEKSLTAIALIFSIFLTRPSPFCLLDEVDAPLDDSNISRFTEMLKKLSGQTQFIVVTHNKRTMEAADSLYGVTMEEPGASAVVSVQFAA